MIQEEVVERLPRKKLGTAYKTGRIGKGVEQLTNERWIDNFNLKSTKQVTRYLKKIKVLSKVY